MELPKLQKKLAPLGDSVAVVVATAEQQTASGIIIPDTADKKKAGQGIVIALGEGGIGEKCPDPRKHLEIGQTVVFGKYAGDDVILKDEEGTDVEVKFLTLDQIRSKIT